MLLEKVFDSSGFFSDYCDCAQLNIISLASGILIIVKPLPESRSKRQSVLPIVIVVFCSATGGVLIFFTIAT